MTKYHLIIIKPGSYSTEVIEQADGFFTEKGSHFFYIERGEEQIIKCVYPVCFTIIESIK